MKIRTTSATTAACLLALAALCASFYLNSASVAASDKERFEFGAEIEHPFGEKSVKGAPFSAQVFLEESQTLASGVHLSKKMTGALYRDSEGRTRHEFPRDGAPELVFINDSVSGVVYNLHMFQHTARKMTLGSARISHEEAERRHHRELEEREHREHLEKTTAHAISVERATKENEPTRKIESLGTQTFDGVAAEGKRFTITIPAGAQGNDRPFEIVSERWYSPELQIVVMSKRSDPREGDLVYRLGNITRGEPSRSLFEAPSDFSVTEEKVELRRKERQ